MAHLFSRFVLFLGTFLSFYIAPVALSADSFNELISFGDSLTDVGNVAGLTVPGVKPVIPGYYQETHFSDFLIWNEIVANFMELPPRTPGRGNSTSLTPLPNGNDWAWGGAEAAAGFDQPLGVIEPIPNLLTQVGQYLAYNTPNRKTLYSIWAGADNLLVGGSFTPEAAQSAVDSIISSMELLEEAGARHFLIFNLPKLGDTPSAISGGPISELFANIYTKAFNKALTSALQKLSHSHRFKGKIYFVNIYKEFLRAVNSVSRKGFYTPPYFVPGPPVVITNVTNEAINIFDATGTLPPNYLFWDDVHPTTQGHQAIAGLVLRVLKFKPN